MIVQIRMFRVMQHLLYSKYPAPYNFGPIYFV